MKSAILLILICPVLWLITSCGSTKPYYTGNGEGRPSSETFLMRESVYTLFAVGGVPLTVESPVLNALQAQAQAGNGLILLGDDVSLNDFPSSASDEMATDHPVFQKIKSLADSFKDFYIIPGEKEWRNGKAVSSSTMQSLDKLLKDVKERGRVLMPAKECGLPEVVRLTTNTILVLMDSEWALEAETHPGDNLPGCELNNVLEMRNAIKDIIQSHRSDQIIFATHHPLYANGPTAGNYSLASHLLPLPIIGSVITGVKSLIGSNQHFGHPAYEAYRTAFQTALEGCKNCVVLSGHEESLQYFNVKDDHYLVAGSGENFRHARKGEQAGFSYMSKGFIRVDVLEGGALRLAFYSVNDRGESTIVWQKEIESEQVNSVANNPGSIPSAYESLDSIVLPASTRYSKKHFLRGEFYRDAWSLPIKMKVLHLGQEHGGLKPLQLGGGNQTRSLRLENEAGEQYVLRSIDKKVTVVLPPELRGTFAENIVQDGIAASHPYGALVVPKLAKAAGVFYTNPSVVYVPHQAALGIYDEEIGDGVYLYEERPGGKTSSFDNFGNTSKTFSTADVIELISESHKHVIDQEAVLRARLFDVWLGDWDRHDDQVRWAAFEENGLMVYRPIPRDRDQVFYKNDGILDYLGSRPYFNPPLRKFTPKIDHLDGLIWAGKYFDRSFLHQLTEEEFIAVAQSMQQNLTDDIIDRAFRDWPANIDSLDGARIRTFLKARRQDLVSYAKEYYLLLAKEVFIPATVDKDVITIHALDQDKLDVTVRRTDDEKSYVHFHRIFHAGETKEIRLFGLNKQDSLILTGDYRPSIRIRFVGGSGKDKLNNTSEKLNVLAYDSPDGMQVSGNAKKHLNDLPLNNSYDRTDWELDRDFHFISPTFFTDEGVGINYSYWWTRYGFRSDPFKSKHAAGLSYFFGTSAFIGKYNGQWLHALGQFDLGMNLFFSGPTYTQYFYGLGNTYVDYDQKKNYHIVSGSQIDLAPSISKRFGIGNSISFTPMYQFINVEDDSDEPRFIYTAASGLSQEDFGNRHYLGATVAYHFSRLDNAGYPSRGLELGSWIGGRSSLTGESISHGEVGAEASLYIPFDVSGTVVLATHVGVDKLLGDYEFFHALTLGGPQHVRGFKTDRFAGDARFYQATDLRLKVLNKQGVVPFQLGLYAAFDYGRVWYEDDVADADDWHTAFGGGLFIVPLSITAFRIGYMVGEDDKQLTIGGALRF